MLMQIPFIEKADFFVGSVSTVVQNKILAFFLIFAIGFIIAKILSFTTKKYVSKITKKTKTEIDDIILSRIERPVFFILLLIVFEISLIPLTLKNVSILKAINTIVVCLITYIVISISEVIVDVWAKGFASRTKSSLDEAVLPLIHKLLRGFFIIIGLMFILGIWGVEIAPLLASLGIAGIAVAFALQNTLGNIFGGISIILDKSVKVGDRLRLDDGTTGTIMDVGLRSTKIKTFDNEVIIIPNGKLADSRIQNLALPDPSSRVLIPFSVEYGYDPEKVRKTILPILKKLDTLKDKDREPSVQFLEMGDFALKFRAVFWVKSYTERFIAETGATEQIYNALRKAKIEIPFPTTNVHILSNKKGRAK